MVAIFNTNPSLKQTLNYNEKKVQSGAAELLWAENYPIDNELLTFQHKLNRLENQAALNENVTRNSIHISLNFDPSEELDNEKLTAIANDYMERMGLSDLPYLVYRHYDSGHPHLHIVSVKVRQDGARVDTQNIGRNQSEKARKAIEISFGLVKAEDIKKEEQYRLEPVNVQKVQYGKMGTKQAINRVLRSVLGNYKFSSLPELNALLKLYNVYADRGSERSTMFHNNGLSYRILDDKGNKVGAAIKASQFFMKPTLKKLQEQFEKNEPLKDPLRSRVKNAIDLSLLRNPKQNLQELMKALEKEGISTVLRQNETGRIYGITYIDHKNKAVFNGSDLGKQYSSNAIQDRCGLPITKSPVPNGLDNSIAGQPDPFVPTANALADALLQQAEPSEALPFELKINKKKKRKRL